MLYWTLQIMSRLVRSFVHLVLTTLKCGKGKTVPPVLNPLLLKSATQLSEEIREGKLKSEDVIRAYIQRIQEVEPLINATADCCFLNAMKEAKDVDALIASGKFTKQQLATEKPFLGVPLTVKVLLKVKGLRSTAASKLFENLVATEDAPSVALMKDAGAIVIATTNSAEMGMDFESSNLVHGKTCNPYDTNRTSGGSSGGESALISAAGSVFGLGNDLLGSVRVPSHFTGIFSHKATVGVIPSWGCHPNPHPKLERFLFTGPMCRYSVDLVNILKVLSSKSDTPMSFGTPVNLKKLKIVYITEIKSPFAASVDKEIKQGLRSAISYFQTKYSVIAKEISIPLLYDANRLAVSSLLSPVEDLKDILTAGQGNHLNEKTELFKHIIGKSTLTRGPLAILNLTKLRFIYNPNRSVSYQETLQKLDKEFSHILDDDTVLLMPTLPVTAPYHSEMIVYWPSTVYTSIFNFLGYPSTQCPIGRDRNGLPFGIQIVGKKHNDPLTVGCAVELEKVFGGWVQAGEVGLSYSSLT